MDRRLNSSLLAFASDLVDEGIDPALDNIQERARVGGVTLASAYHDARDIFPHNPRRVVYFQEPGAVFFQPNPERWRTSPIRPLPSSLTGPRDLLAEVVAACKERGLESNAWAVLFHTDRGRETESAAPKNAFGDPYLTYLCPSHPDAQAYGEALVGELASRGVDSILLEAFHFHPLEHGFHHERAFVEVDQMTSFLLGLCFCEFCMAAAEARGVDAARLRHDVARHTRGALGDGIGRSDLPGKDGVRAMFGGAMGAFLDARSATVTTVVKTLARVVEGTGTTLIPVDPSGAIKGYTGGRPSGEPAPETSWKLGVDLSELAAATPTLEVMGYAADPARVRTDLEAYVRSLPESAELGVILRPMLPDCEAPENVAAKVLLAAELGCSRIDFYHYGLAPLHALDWIREALSPTRQSEEER